MAGREEWYFEADVPEDIKQIDQLYVNGKAQRMARYPNAVEGKNVFDTWNLNEKAEAYQDPLSKVCTDRWKNPEGAYLHTMHEALWGDMHWLVTSKKQDGSLAMIGGWQNNRPSKMHPVYRMIENVLRNWMCLASGISMQRKVYCIICPRRVLIWTMP